MIIIKMRRKQGWTIFLFSPIFLPLLSGLLELGKGASVTGGKSGCCAPPWTGTKYGCYLLNNESCKNRRGKNKSGCNWYQALKMCNRMDAGLANFKSQDELDELNIYLDKKGSVFPYWIDHIEGDEFSAWCNKRPEERPPNKCTFLKFEKARNASAKNTRCWETTSCHLLRFPLCVKIFEKDAKSSTCPHEGMEDIEETTKSNSSEIAEASTEAGKISMDRNSFYDDGNSPTEMPFSVAENTTCISVLLYEKLLSAYNRSRQN